MNKIARYVQVKNYIIDGIRNKDWSEGERVPSENQLVKLCEVSRMTARRAVKELTTEGVLFSRQGQGTFVATAKSRSSVMTLRNIADEISERNHQHSCEVLELKSCINDEISQQLGWETGQALYFSRMIHFENNVAIQLEERFVQPNLAPDYLKQNFHSSTTYEYLMKVCPINEADHLIEAVVPSLEQSKWLNIALTEPCLKISRTTYAEQHIASFAYLYHPGTRFQLGNHIRLMRGN